MIRIKIQDKIKAIELLNKCSTDRLLNIVEVSTKRFYNTVTRVTRAGFVEYLELDCDSLTVICSSRELDKTISDCYELIDNCYIKDDSIQTKFSDLCREIYCTFKIEVEDTRA